MKIQSKVERKSDREYVITRTINGPRAMVYEAWTKPELFKKWWVPKSFPITLVSCDMDVRTGGKYRLVFSAGGQTAEFFGKYLEATPPSRIVWTNDEGGPEAANVTAVTFEEVNGATLVTVTELYPSKAALDEALSSGSIGGFPEQLEQLDALLASR